MLLSANSIQRILKVIENDGDLAFHYYYSASEDGYSWLTRITLQHNGKKVTLWTDDVPRNAALEALAKHADLRESYDKSYYGSENYSGPWYKTFESKRQPVPLWISEQWGWDEHDNWIIPPDSAVFADADTQAKE